MAELWIAKYGVELEFLEGLAVDERQHRRDVGGIEVEDGGRATEGAAGRAGVGRGDYAGVDDVGKTRRYKFCG